jgi:Cys-tRNA(Pro) deacylase
VRSFTDVQDALSARGVEHEIIQLPSSSRTARLAADALGVPVSSVVKSLVFMADGRPVLALVDGEATVDTEALARELGAGEVALARGREVRDLTGYKPGAVPPVGLATALPVVADPAVFVPDVVYCGGGSTTAMLRIGAADLRELTTPRVLPIAGPG